MTSTLAPGYDPTQFEARLYQEWERSGVFQPSGKGEPYTILLPPPNVTGTLHMGHAFQHTLQDALIRYHRMRGYDTLWQMGTDHAGIATEMVVARNLGREGLSRDGLGREGFIEKVWEWREQSGHTIERQMRRLGTSGDWTRSMFTMDPMAADAVVEAFVRLHEEGLIYRGQRLVNWDPVLKTAISDLEVVNEEEDGFLWSISYPLTDGNGSLVVATTRPETMLGDTAVMVHPDDERYRHLIGKTVTLPLTGRLIPVIADDYVDREFGTGVVKVTPAHDFNDYAVGQRHGLPLINILDDDASVRHEAPRIDIEVREHQFDGEGRFQPSSFASWPVQSTEKLPDRYAGLDRYEARKVVLADLDAAGLLVETKPHKLQVPRGDRTGQVIEPYLTDQWFVKMDGLAARGMQLVENGDVKFVPANWINTYRHWMENIQDWCISRQLWWGHRIPAWYDARNRVYVGRSRDDAQLEFEASLAAIRNTLPGSRLAKGDASSGEGIARLQKELEFLQSNGLKQDNDVLETWFSAQLWPISTMGWPNQTLMDTRGFDKYVPSSVLVTGFDIIFFWVARMIMATDHFMPQDRADAERVPFRHVYITGLVRDKDGQKMSKSKGNILDPLDLIDGISLDDLVAKRTAGLMQPEMAGKIEKATRREFPEGIPAFGADALRFTIAALATHGRDIRFDIGRAEGYKNFCNKLWNATRFVLMNTDGYHASGTPQPATDAEKWILSRLAKVSAEAETHFASYRFDLLAQALYEFAWNEFCDWFVEFSKSALQPKVNLQTGEELLRIKKRQAEVAQSVRHTLLYVLEALLRLLHPLIPFVSEELWRSVAPKLGIDGDTISLQIYPRASDFATQGFAQAETDIEWLKAMVSALRRVRSELGVSPTKGIRLLISGDDSLARSRIEKFQGELRMMARLDLLTETNDWWLASGVEPPPAATAIVGDLKLFVPLEGLVDLDAERTRLDKELKRVEGELAKSQGKLASETFVQNAPAAVVEQERQRLADWGAQRDALAMQRAKLS